MRNKIALVGVGIVVGLAFVFAGWKAMSAPYAFQGSLIDPPVPAADFTLTDQYNHPFQLSQQRGKVVLIFFGYTNCPDVCPLTLSEFKQVKTQLGEQAGKVEFVFVTVDPERDTQEVLRKHLANFDESFIGLTGSRSELEKVWHDYGVYQAQQDTGSAGGNAVDHTGTIYAIDEKGNWRLTYSFGMEASKLIDDVQHLVSEG